MALDQYQAHTYGLYMLAGYSLQGTSMNNDCRFKKLVLIVWIRLGRVQYINLIIYIRVENHMFLYGQEYKFQVKCLDTQLWSLAQLCFFFFD